MLTLLAAWPAVAQTAARNGSSSDRGFAPRVGNSLPQQIPRDTLRGPQARFQTVQAPARGADGLPAAQNAPPSLAAANFVLDSNAVNGARVGIVEATDDGARLFTSAAQSGSSLRSSFGDWMWGGGQIVEIMPGVSGAIPVPGGARVFKLAENGIVIPSDRVYFTYHHYNNGYFAADAGGSRSIDVGRYTLGVEKTFWCGMASLEARLPLGNSYDFAGDLAIASDDGIGNVGLAAKFLVAQKEFSGWSAGVHASLPTAPDADGDFMLADFYTVRNQAVHLGPFLGFYTESCDRRAYTQTMLQFDFDVNGNDIDVTGVFAGNLRSQSLVFLDWSFGYWLHHDSCDGCGHGSKGLLALCELHYTGTLQDSDFVPGPGGGVARFGSRTDSLQVVDFSFALHLEREDYDVRAGVVVPVNGSSDGYFDFEFGVQFNYWFGGRKYPGKLPEKYKDDEQWQGDWDYAHLP